MANLSKVILFLVSAALFGFAQAPAETPEIRYEGFELRDIEIHLEATSAVRDGLVQYPPFKLRDGEIALYLEARDESKTILKTWIRSGENFLGYRVTTDNRGGSPGAVFLPLNGMIDGERIGFWSVFRAKMLLGYFGTANLGDKLVTTCIGDTFNLAGKTYSLKNLSLTLATLQEDKSADTTEIVVPLSSTGELRSDHFALVQKLNLLERKIKHQDDADYSAHDLWFWVWVFVLSATVMIYAGIAIGLLTLEDLSVRPNVHRQPAKRG